jgi:hypothetical protein
MEHVGARPLGNRFDVVFSDPILMLGTHPTERKLLVLSNAMVLEVFSRIHYPNGMT